MHWQALTLRNRTQDPYAVNELGQACRTSLANDGPAVVLGCNADATGLAWDTWKGKKVPFVLTLMPVCAHIADAEMAGVGAIRKLLQLPTRHDMSVHSAPNGRP